MTRDVLRRLSVLALWPLLVVAIAACTSPTDETVGGETPAPAATSIPATRPNPTAAGPAATSTSTPAPTATVAASPTLAPTPAATATAAASPTQAPTPTATSARRPSPSPTPARAATPTTTLSLDGIAVAPENCAGYDRDHFADYDARALRDAWDAEDGAADGVITGWYTGLRLPNSGQAVHVEHVVALKEAWCSGYREASLGNWSTNLRPAQAALNRSKSDRDPAEWDRPDLPEWCRYLALHVEVKRELGMTADRAEIDYIADSWATHCGDAAPVPTAERTPTPVPTPTAGTGYGGPQPARTCGEFGWRVDRRTHPNLYAALADLGMRDGNSDGIMCNAERAYSGPDYPAQSPTPTATSTPAASPRSAQEFHCHCTRVISDRTRCDQRYTAQGGPGYCHTGSAHEDFNTWPPPHSGN